MVAGLAPEAHARRPFIAATDPGIVEAGYLEVEAGIGLSRNTRNGANESTWNLPSAVFNLGILENFEIDIATGIDLFREKLEGSRRRTLAGLTETSLTAKNRWFAGDGMTPSFTTEMTLHFLTQRREMLSASSSSRKVNFSAVLVAGAQLGPLEYMLNLGGGVVESPRKPVGTVGSLLWAVAGELPVAGELSAVAELRGESVRRSRPESTIPGGFVWKSPAGIKFDIAGIGGLSRGADNWGITFGLTYAFKAIPALAR